MKMINRNLMSAMLGWVMVQAGLVTGVQAATVPSPGYQYIYDASSGLLPSSLELDQPAWRRYFGAPTYTSTDSVANDVLTLNAPSQQYLIYRMLSGTSGDDYSSWNPNLSLGSTVEFSAMITSGVNLVQGLTVVTPTNQFAVAFGTSGIQTFSYGSTRQYSYANTGDFHTYRVELTTQNTANVYVDGIFAFTTNGSGVSGSTPYLEFGNGSAALAGGSVEYEYIQWTNLGVVPEPSQMALMALAASFFMVLLWRKRRVA